jgi:hypothetical protein
MDVRLNILQKISEDLAQSRKTCDEFQKEILVKDETINKLSAKLKALQLPTAPPLITVEVLNEIPRKRAEATERCRIEYENRVGITDPIDFSSFDNIGYDEIDLKTSCYASADV